MLVVFIRRPADNSPTKYAYRLTYGHQSADYPANFENRQRIDEHSWNNV